MLHAMKVTQLANLSPAAAGFPVLFRAFLKSLQNCEGKSNLVSTYIVI